MIEGKQLRELHLTQVNFKEGAIATIAEGIKETNYLRVINFERSASEDSADWGALMNALAYGHEL